MEINSVNPNLYLNASQIAGQTQAQQAKQNQKTSNVKSGIQSKFQKAQEEARLISIGLPPEIAGMDTEDAAIYLMDQTDIARDVLKEHQTLENFTKYRSTVQNFLKFILDNNYEVHIKKRPGFKRSGKPLDPRVKVVIINEQLDQMAVAMLHKHRDSLKLLNKMNEIRGLLIDIMVA